MVKHSQEQVLDELDRSILSILQTEGRISNLELARRVHLSPPATHERVHRLEEGGYIQRYVALLDREKVGFDLLCFIHVSMQMHQLREVGPFLEALRQIPEILEGHHITGEYDYLLKVVVRNHRELEQLVMQKLTAIPGIARLSTSVVFREIKGTTALPLQLPPSDLPLQE